MKCPRCLATEALAWHRNRGERGAEAWDLWLLGEIGAQESPREAPTTADLLRQALTLADELAMRPSPPTATSALAGCPGARASGKKRSSASPPRRRCTARWA